jgi:hypothetical protein
MVGNCNDLRAPFCDQTGGIATDITETLHGYRNVTKFPVLFCQGFRQHIHDATASCRLTSLRTEKVQRFAGDHAR